MKRMLILLVLCMMCLTSAVYAEDAECVYYNHDGGEYYHARPDCERIGQGYWNAMTKIAAEDLSDEAFAGLKRCAWCFGETQQPDVPEGKTSWHYESPFDTGSDVEITQAGQYFAGKDLNPGVYTAVGGDNADGIVWVLDADGVGINEFVMTPGVSCSFYLGENTSVELPESCTLRRVRYEPKYQTMEKVEVVSGCFFVMYECPGRIYMATLMDGQTVGDAWVTRINPETGREERVVERKEVKTDETIVINLQQGYDCFLRLRNCIIWPAEEGEG